jgi:hypothetical protein
LRNSIGIALTLVLLLGAQSAGGRIADLSTEWPNSFAWLVPARGAPIRVLAWGGSHSGKTKANPGVQYVDCARSAEARRAQTDALVAFLGPLARARDEKEIELIRKAAPGPKGDGAGPRDSFTLTGAAWIHAEPAAPAPDEPPPFCLDSHVPDDLVLAGARAMGEQFFNWYDTGDDQAIVDHRFEKGTSSAADIAAGRAALQCTKAHRPILSLITPMLPGAGKGFFVMLRYRTLCKGLPLDQEVWLRLDGDKGFRIYGWELDVAKSINR